MTQLTSEIFESNDLTVYQPARGHRYGAESVALMRFVRAEPGLAFCELGAGCGLISLVIATELSPASVTAVEIQKTLHEIALYNISENELDDIVACVNEDMREFERSRTLLIAPTRS
jgi:tRNA1Val (adenine37-N6)-methyltransferase